MKAAILAGFPAQFKLGHVVIVGCCRIASGGGGGGGGGGLIRISTLVGVELISKAIVGSTFNTQCAP